MAEHWLEGEVNRLLWSSDQTGYAVVRFHTSDDQDVIVVGNLSVLAEGGEGTFAALEGRWEEHPVHGRQFRASGLLTGTPRSLEGMRMYLGSAGVHGIGPRLAHRIVERFGLRTPVVIQDEPRRLAEVEGIGPTRASAISEAWKRDEAGRALTMTLRGLGIAPRLIARVRDRYGDNAATIVAREPYRLAEEIRGIGFKTADLLAKHQGIAHDDPRRVRAAVVHVLDRDSGEEHRRALRAEVGG